MRGRGCHNNQVEVVALEFVSKVSKGISSFELIKVHCGLNPLKLRLIINYVCSLKRQTSEDFFHSPVSC